MSGCNIVEHLASYLFPMSLSLLQSKSFTDKNYLLIGDVWGGGGAIEWSQNSFSNILTDIMDSRMFEYGLRYIVNVTDAPRVYDFSAGKLS